MTTFVNKTTGPNETAIIGESQGNEGIRGISHSPHGGVVGVNDCPIADGWEQGVWGESDKGEGIRGISHSADHAGVVGTNDKSAKGIWGQCGSRHRYSWPITKRRGCIW